MSAEKRGTDRIDLSRYDAHEAFRGHGPALVVDAHGVVTTRCICDLNDSGPFIWHAVNLLADATRAMDA